MSILFAILIFSSLTVYALILLYLGSGLNHLEDYHKSDKTPFVSVVVCAHNEEHNIADCLESLMIQEYPKNNIEFIIMDDRSSDATAKIIDSYAKKDKRIKRISITDIIDDFAPKKRAIDTAINQSNGEIILLTDADGRPSKRWVAEMVLHFADNTDMVIGYAPYNIEPEYSVTMKLLALEYLS